MDKIGDIKHICYQKICIINNYKIIILILFTILINYVNVIYILMKEECI